MAHGPSAIIGYGLTGRSLSRWLKLENEAFKIFDSDRALSLKNPQKGVIEELHVTTDWSVKNWEEALRQDGVRKENVYHHHLSPMLYKFPY